jgi:hypothetical protein
MTCELRAESCELRALSGARFASIPHMSDDFGTINVTRGERAREIEVLRQHYRQHREALVRMTADAPTEHLASEYQRLIVEIDRALGKLSELEGGAAMPVALPVPPPPVAQAAPSRLKTEPGMRPLVTSPIAEETDEPPEPSDLPLSDEPSRSRVPLILGVAILALALIGWLIWRASSDKTAAPAIVTETGTTNVPVSTAPDTSIEEAPAPAPAAAASALVPAPRVQDYGTIRKGTRAVRQFQITNNSDEPISIEVTRSACRCLFYEYQSLIPPKAKETLTVTVDGAKAKAGMLRENLKVSKKKDPSVATSVEVNATIQ